MEVDYGNEDVKGIPLLEIFSVSINKNVVDDDDDVGDRRSEIYGTIRVVDGRGTKAFLYDRPSHDSEAITQNNSVTLKSAERCISALTNFTIDVDLKDRYGNLEISKGKISWSVRNDCYYDKLLSIFVPGMNGYATVNCAVFSVAIEAVLQIVLLETDDQQAGCSSNILSAAEVYGTVVAHYGRKFDYSSSDQRKYFWMTLFNRQQNDAVKLAGNNSIPLTRSIIALPAYSSIILEANLFVRGTNATDSRVQRVQGKTAEIIAAFMKESDVRGEGLTARVNVRGHEPYRDEDFK